MEKNQEKTRRKKDRKAIDGIILIILICLVVAMTVFASTRETSNQEIILMEIYKSAGPETSTATMNHYYIYSNTNSVDIRISKSDGSHTTLSKTISKEVINNFENSLNQYISENPTINSSFYINERYTIEYNGNSIVVPNPTVSELLGFDSSKYTFYNTVDEFINNINK